MGEVLARANAMPVSLRQQIVTHVAGVEGPRWSFGPLWLDQTVAYFNERMGRKGWKPLKVVDQKKESTWFRSAFVFTLEGEAYMVQAFMDVVTRTIEEENGCT